MRRTGEEWIEQRPCEVMRGLERGVRNRADALGWGKVVGWGNGERPDQTNHLQPRRDQVSGHPAAGVQIEGASAAVSVWQVEGCPDCAFLGGLA